MEIVQSSLKNLSGEDFTWQSDKEGIEKMSKQNGSTENEIDDGAQEKMLKEDTKAVVTSMKTSTEVEYGSSNGDTKINIEVVKQTLSGMGKEELMKYANDPFWIRLRWFLFIAFWVLWFAMLAGAIAIIVLAPKCSAPEAKKFWEISPLVELELSDAQSLKDFERHLDTLKEQNVMTVSLPPIFKASSPGHVIDFKAVDEKFGEMSDLENLIKIAKEKGQHIVLDLDPNHSSDQHEWFTKSINKEDPYTSYYVWTDGNVADNGTHLPPNNWASKVSGSAWEWNEKRKQFYLCQFNKTQPDLNFTNSKVIAEFEDIFAHWLRLGVRGFRLLNTRYLTEDPELKSEGIEPELRLQTRDRIQNGEILRKWREVVNNHTNGEGLFAMKDEIRADMLQLFNEKTQLIDLPQNSHFLADKSEQITAESLNKSIPQWLSQSSWPGWQLNGKRILRKHMPSQMADSIILMTLLLPGTPIVKINDTTSAKVAFATLSKARQEMTFLYGVTNTTTVHNNTVFAYTRLKSGNPGYLVAYHSGNESIVTDLTSIQHVPEEVTVLTYSPNYTRNVTEVKTKLSTNAIPMSPKSTLVMTFVPN